MIKKCKYEECNKSFETKEKRRKYCCPECRYLHHKEEMARRYHNKDAIVKTDDYVYMGHLNQ